MIKPDLRILAVDHDFANLLVLKINLGVAGFPNVDISQGIEDAYQRASNGINYGAIVCDTYFGRHTLCGSNPDLLGPTLGKRLRDIKYDGQIIAMSASEEARELWSGIANDFIFKRIGYEDDVTKHLLGLISSGVLT